MSERAVIQIRSTVIASLFGTCSDYENGISAER